MNKKKASRGFIILLIISMIAAPLFGLTYQANAGAANGKTTVQTDSTAPEIKSLSFSKTDVIAGENISVDMDVVEEESGIERITLQFKSDSDAMWFSMPQSLAYTGHISWEETIDAWSGEYSLTCITVSDMDGNSSCYIFDPESNSFKSEDGLFSFTTTETIIKISGKEKEQIAGQTPNMTSFELVNTELFGNDKLYVDLTEDNENASKLESAYLSFISYYNLGEKTLSASISYWCSNFTYDGNHVRAEFELNGSDMPQLSAEYQLESFSFTSYNHQGVSSNYYSGNNQFRGEEGYYIDVKGGNTIKYTSSIEHTDYTSPKLLDLRLVSPKEMTKPGIVKYEIDVWDDQGILQEPSIDGPIMPKVNFVRSSTVKDGVVNTYLVSVPVEADYEFDKFVFPRGIDIADSSYNTTYYALNEDEKNKYEFCYSYLRILGEDARNEKEGYDPVALPEITIKNEFDFAVDTSVTNAKLPDILKSLHNGSAARIKLYNHLVAKKELFETIKGRDITLVFDGESLFSVYYQYIINGKDVKTPKDVTLYFDIYQMDRESYGTDKEVLGIDFADNGELPGVMECRVKVSQISHELNLDSPVYIYYDNEKEAELELEEEAKPYGLIDGSDTWLCFSMTHNSMFYSTNGKLARRFKVGEHIDSKKYNASFLFKADNELEYIGYNFFNGTAVNIIIPSTIKLYGKKYKVASIGKYALSDIDSIKTVSVGKNVREIGKEAFMNCTSLQKISLAEGIRSFGKNAFKGCSKLSDITLGGEAALVKNHSVVEKVKISIPKKIEYTGNAIKPVTSVKAGKTKLKEGKDYTVSYKNNKNVGISSMIIKGKGKYVGTVKKTFKIEKGKTTFTVKVSKPIVKAKNYKKKSGTVAIKVSKLSYGSSKVTYSLKSVTKGQKNKVTVDAKTGKVTIKKGIKKCEINVVATSKENACRKKMSKVIKIKVA